MSNLMIFNVFFKVTLSGHTRFVGTGSPLKFVENAFYFTLKVLLVLEILKILSLLFVHVKKRHYKNKVVFDFTTSQPG